MLNNRKFFSRLRYYVDKIGNKKYFLESPYVNGNHKSEILIKLIGSEDKKEFFGYKWSENSDGILTPWNIFLEENGYILDLNNTNLYKKLLKLIQEDKNVKNIIENDLFILFSNSSEDFDSLNILPLIESMTNHYNRKIQHKSKEILCLFYLSFVGDYNYVLQKRTDLEPTFSENGRWLRLIAIDQILQEGMDPETVANWSKFKSPNGSEVINKKLELKRKYKELK